MIDETYRYTDKDMLAFKQSIMILSEFRERKKKKLILNDPLLHEGILVICSDATGANYIKTISRSRDMDAVFARYLTMFFMKKLKDQGHLKKHSSLAQLGRMAGGKHHATTIWGIKTVEEVLEINSSADKRLSWFKTALNEIENRLHLTLRC